MIRAYCDKCGEQIDADVPGGVRLILGKREWSGHLCGEHQAGLHVLVTAYCEARALRKVSR